MKQEREATSDLHARIMKAESMFSIRDSGNCLSKRLQIMMQCTTYDTERSQLTKEE